MVKTVFALMLVFSDGYVGGHTTAAHLKDRESCDKQGAKLVAQYAAWGHPASYSCLETAPPQKRAPVVIQRNDTLPP
jgi:hypothetical protein